MSLGLLIALVAGVLVIVVGHVLSRRIGVAGPLILVAIGVGVSLIPAVPAVTVDPQLILVGVLPPLLYSAAVSAPAIEFRRDIRAIGGLSVLLVVVSALVVGFIISLLIPGLGFPLSVALAAILSPTDAVATTIVKRLGVPRRIVTVLEGESLVNDASALVLLRTAVFAAASGFSLLTTIGSFAWAVLAAVMVGLVVGVIAVRVRAMISSATANTALGLTIPYIAYVPAEALGGSGLVSAVVAGIVCGQGAVRWLTPEQRISDVNNWRTIEFVLEGAVFLTMGLELWGIIEANIQAHEGLMRGVWIAVIALFALLVVRAVWVVPMLGLHNANVKRRAQRRVEASTSPPPDGPLSSLPGVAHIAARKRSAKRLRRIQASVEYFSSSPLTWKHNVVIIWAGMRGAVTLAAAQTLPRDTPERELLVFVAFLVAAGSLVLQGMTLPMLTRMLGLRTPGADGLPRKEIRRLDHELRRAAQEALTARSVVQADGSLFPDRFYTTPLSRFTELPGVDGAADDVQTLQFELAVIGVMRQALHRMGRSGRHSTAALRHVLYELDAYEISVKLRLESEQ